MNYLLYSIDIAVEQGFRYKEPTDGKIWVSANQVTIVVGTGWCVCWWVCMFEFVSVVCVRACKQTIAIVFSTLRRYWICLLL